MDKAFTTLLLKAGTSQEVAQYLTSPIVAIGEGMKAMATLLETRPTVANEVLCSLYDIACYKVGESCFRDSAPEAEQDKWFVSTLAEDSRFATVTELANSEEEAFSLAVGLFNLKELFFSEARALDAMVD